MTPGAARPAGRAPSPPPRTFLRKLSVPPRQRWDLRSTPIGLTRSQPGRRTPDPTAGADFFAKGGCARLGQPRHAAVRGHRKPTFRLIPGGPCDQPRVLLRTNSLVTGRTLRTSSASPKPRNSAVPESRNSSRPPCRAAVTGARDGGVAPPTAHRGPTPCRLARFPQGRLCSPTALPSVSMMMAMKPCSPMENLGRQIFPPADSIRDRTSSNSPFTLR